MFQSTHPRGVRPRRPTHRTGFHGFNPRTRVGCDRNADSRTKRHDRVSIHAPAWGATRPVPRPCDRAKSFNPRTRVGCDRLIEPFATFFIRFNPRTRVGCDWYVPYRLLWDDWVSIHAPAWGATLSCRLMSGLSASFNPRTRVGCDDDYRSIPSQVSGVSIHAPAWGATMPAAIKGKTYRFQSTHPRGVRPFIRRYFPSSIREFQSTHPRGVRLRTILTLNGSLKFQSTHPRGVRLKSCHLAQYISRFQSTHPRGVRRVSTRCGLVARKFQSTHPRGVRLFPCFIQ